MYRDITVSDNSYHFSLRPFPVTAGNVMFAVIPICSEWGSRVLVQYIAANIKIFTCRI
jgi:hypothetical protein